MNVATHIQIPAEDRQRADLYNFLGVILSSPPDEIMLAQVAGLSGDDTDLGQAITILAKLAKLSKPKMVEREFNNLFIGVGRGELLPYASYYMTGFLNEKPLATLRLDMSRLGLARSETVFEPEDNIASLMEIMAAMIVGRFGEPVPLQEQRNFFNTHIAPWARVFFADLEGAEGSVFYAPVGTVGRTFIEVEAEAFRMSGQV
ncbi:TorD/DmsD family molecular chaperone [Roseobacter sp. CCS2]|uniref:TorD/DmsD family molecular chaperone n=1 Tax=Roseobacter sp. CCS2 TaxID=391593 RepID=UPI0000F403DF|nr:molecular chaperone TorD family protein [Roseobacter sp. CCS2]EBA13955.1 cytoplasmic chaperone TorD [Roseobacter sp. CCS2]